MADHDTHDHTGVPGVGGSVATDTIWDAAGDLAVGTGANTAARVALGTTGQALVSNGTTAVWGRPKGTPVDFGFNRYVGGNITLNNTSWTDISGPSDITLSASTGDIVEICFSGHFANEAVNAAIDAATIVSASPVNYVSGGGGGSDIGVSGWLGLNTGSNSAVGACVMYTLQSGDISGGTVTWRLRYRTLSGANKVLNASTTSPLQWSVKNLGPAI